MKNKHLIKTYTLSDGQKVTCRQVADEIQISESAARNRLNRSDQMVVNLESKTGIS